MTLPDQLLRMEDLARLLGDKTVEALRVQRHRNPESLPPAIKIGNRVFFDPRDVEAWIDSQRENGGPAKNRRPQSTPRHKTRKPNT